MFLRVCHTACLGSDNDVVVFGGSSNMRILVDLVCEGKLLKLVKDLRVDFSNCTPNS